MKKKIFVFIVIGVVGVFIFVGCSSDGVGGMGGGDGSFDDKGMIMLGFLLLWIDGLSMVYLLQDQFEKIGYMVEMKMFIEVGLLYIGFVQGDVDMYLLVWLEFIYVEYMKKYGDDIEDFGVYYENVKFIFVVLEYFDLILIEDFVGKGGDFDGKIYGIELGVGFIVQMQKMMFEYGLDGEYEFVILLIVVMFIELKIVIDKQEDIVVMLWCLFWVNDVFLVKDFEDFKGVMGEVEGLYFLGIDGFVDEFFEVVELIKKIKFDDEQYGVFEDFVVNEYGEGKEVDVVDVWFEQYGDQFDWIVIS